MLSDTEMRERMSKGWRMGYPETVCGNGSLRANSKLSRAAIPQWCAKYGITSVCDAGAGDLHYVRGIDWLVEYQAFDLCPWSPEVTAFDITTQPLPPCDAILCRMVLNHLDEMRIQMALHLFRQSGRYLIATQFNGEDLPQRSPQFTRLDLSKPPYSLGEPLESVQDGTEDTCRLALWNL
jgi:hypothetical protein